MEISPVLSEYSVFSSDISLISSSLDVKAQGSNFTDHHVEGFRNARFRRILAVDDSVIDLGTAHDIIGLHGQKFLQGVRSAVGFESPDFHFAEALAAELTLAAERLLRHEGVGADGACVDLIFDQVTQLQVIHITDRDGVQERLAGAAVVNLGLADDVVVFRIHLVIDDRGLLIGLFEFVHDVFEGRAVEHASRDLEAEDLSGPAEVNFKHLTHVHTGRHAQRIQKNLQRATVFGERHVFDRNDLGHAALVTVTACHLITDGEAALFSDIDLDGLEDAGLELVTLRDLVDFLFHFAGKVVEAVLGDLHQTHSLVLRVRVVAGENGGGGNLCEIEAREQAFGQSASFRDDNFMSLVVQNLAAHLTVQDVLEIFTAGSLDAVDFRLELFLDSVDRFLIFALVLLVRTVLAGEHAGLDDHALHSRRSLEGRIPDVARLFAENGAEEAFFRGLFGFALRRHLADQDIFSVDFGADADNAAFVEVAESVFAHVRNFTGELFRAALGITDFKFIFFDMNGSERVLDRELFGNDHRVFVVVTVPRKESDEDVLAEGKFSVIRGGAVRKDIARVHELSDVHDRLLIDAGILVGAFELAENIFIDGFAAEEFIILAQAFERLELAVFHRTAFDDDLSRIDELDAAGVLGADDSARIKRGAAFKAGTDDRRFGTEQRHSLALHVGAHEGAVSVSALRERHAACGHRDNLLRRHVHQVDAVSRIIIKLNAESARDMRIFALIADDHILVLEVIIGIEFGASRRDLIVVFFISRDIGDETGDLLIDVHGCLDVISLAAELFKHGTVAHKRALAFRVLELEHLVDEGVEEFALAIVQRGADLFLFLVGKFQQDEEVRLVHESTENAEVPFLFREMERLAVLAAEFEKTDDAVRSLDETEMVDHRVRGEGVDKTDVRAFRRVERAEASVVRIVHVADFEARAFAGKAAGAESGKTTLVRKFGQRVHLVHELRKLAGTEERLHHGIHGAGVHEVTRRKAFVFAEGKILTDHAAHAAEADGELVREKFAHGTRAAVAKVVDIVEDIAFDAIVETDHVIDDRKEVRFAHRHRLKGRRGKALRGELLFDVRSIDLRVQAITADFAEIILARILEEHVIKENFCGGGVRSFFL